MSDTPVGISAVQIEDIDLLKRTVPFLINRSESCDTSPLIAQIDAVVALA